MVKLRQSSRRIDLNLSIPSGAMSTIFNLLYERELELHSSTNLSSNAAHLHFLSRFSVTMPHREENKRAKCDEDEEKEGRHLYIYFVDYGVGSPF